MYVSNDLFGIPNNSKEIRTHFRIHTGDKYVQYVVIEGSKMSSHSHIHDIPDDKESLIKTSFEIKSSIIASIDNECVFNVNTQWDDFMTITYCDIIKDDKPFLSMAISINNKEEYFDLLAFLNWYKIENKLQYNIKQVDNVCDIVKILG